MADARYTVQEPIRHDGNDLAVGAEVKLSAALAAPLIAAGVVVAVAPVAAKAEKAK